MFAMALGQFIVLLVISHALGPAGVGAFSLTIRTVSLISMLITLGLPSIVTRTRATEKPSTKKSSTVTTSLLLTLPLAFVLYLVLILFSPRIELVFGAPGLALLLIVHGLTLPLSVLGGMSAASVRGELKFGRFGIVTASTPIVNTVLVLICFSWLSPILAIILGVISAGVGALLALAFAAPSTWGYPDTHLLRKMIIAGAPLLVVSLAGIFIDSIDLFVLGFMSFDLAVIGAYSNAFSVSSYLRYLIEPISLALLPIASSTLSSSRYEETESILKVAVRIIIVFFAPIAVVCSMLSQELLLLLFPTEFVMGAPALSILAISTVGLALYYLANRILIAGEKTRLLGASLMVCAFVDFLLTIPLTYYFGMLGAAASSAITFVLMGLVMVHLVNRQFGFHIGVNRMDVTNCMIILVVCLLGRHLFLQLTAPFGSIYPLFTVGFVLALVLITEAVLKPLSSAELQLVLGLLERPSIPRILMDFVKKLLRLFTRQDTRGL
jgi:O-antigen/teichoic acid export membrane protein